MSQGFPTFISLSLPNSKIIFSCPLKFKNIKNTHLFELKLKTKSSMQIFVSRYLCFKDQKEKIYICIYT